MTSKNNKTNNKKKFRFLGKIANREYYPFYKKNLSLAIPVMISQLGQSIVMLADNIMTGRLGTNALAACSFANAIFIIGFVLAQGIGFGSTPLIGPNYSSGKYKQAGSLFHHSIITNIITAIIVGSMMYMASFYMDRMGQDEEVSNLAIPYYRVLVLSLLPYMIFLSFKQFMEGIGNTKYAMIITIISNIINIIFNYLLIFGKCGFPEMGVLGAGIASLLARISMPILYLALFNHKKSLWRYFFFFKSKELKWKKFGELTKIGLPIGLQMFIECFVFSASAVIAGWFGAVSLASHQIAMNMSSLTFMVVTGIASATTIVVSHEKGKNNTKNMKTAGIASLQITFIYSLLCALVIFALRNNIPHLFSTDEKVMEMAATLLTLAAIYQLADGMQCVCLGALRGMADVKASMYIAIFCYMFINLPASYLIAVKFNTGAIGVWWGFIIGLNSLFICILSRFIHITRKLESAKQ